jgi:hypothetical protein
MGSEWNWLRIFCSVRLGISGMNLQVLFVLLLSYVKEMLQCTFPHPALASESICFSYCLLVISIRERSNFLTHFILCIPWQTSNFANFIT